MIIADIIEQEDGTLIAIVTDDAGNPVGINTYGPDSYPRPELGEITEAGVIRRFWRWVTGG
jgi:hypothetical protein